MNQTREDKAEAARVRLAELAGKFMDRTATDIATMRAGLAALDGGDAAAMAEFRHLAHRMVGTGATLGFDSLSNRAARIEELAEACAGKLPDEGIRAQLHSALDALQEEYRRQRGAS
jgi:HPt (histidine-containing phosphotransfer) domain-containing protein